MDKFYKTEEGKLLDYLVHEQGNAMAIILSSLSLLKKYKEMRLIDVDIEGMINKIKLAVKRNNDASDYVYENFKKRHYASDNSDKEVICSIQ